MRPRPLFLTGLVAVVAAGSFAPAVAAPKPKPKPIVVSYTTGPTTPDPTTSGTPNDTCDVVNPTARDRHAFKVPAAGRLQVAMQQTGDWALAVRDKDGATLSKSDGGSPTDVESIDMRFKKAGQISVDACNFLGAPTAKITITFTYK